MKLKRLTGYISSIILPFIVFTPLMISDWVATLIAIAITLLLFLFIYFIHWCFEE